MSSALLSAFACRRFLQTFVGLVFIALVIAPAFADDVQLSGTDAFLAMQKTTCGTTQQGVTRYGVFEGRVYSRVPGEKDTHLFDALGINTRHCNVLKDSKRGKGFRSISREIMVYMDPKTGEIIDQWKNPWTGKTIEIMHVANDPVNMREPRWERDEDGNKSLKFSARRYGDAIATSYEIPLFYDNPLGSDYQAFVGGKYHAMEIFNTFYDADKLLNARSKVLGDSRLSWSRVAQWLPWLEMGDKPGLMVFNATGFSTLDKRKIPQALMDVLKTRYPTYLTPPPLDDERANETSWTVFKKGLDALKDDKTQ